jgi:chromosomal replication initiator protein
VLHAVRKITEARKSDQQLNHELHVLDQIIKG